MVQHIDRAEGLIGTLGMKAPVRCASNINKALFGEQIIDQILLTDGDRALLRAQTNPVENGIWIVRHAEWERAADFDGTRDVLQGTLIPVSAQIGINASTIWQLATPDPVLIDTSPLIFVLIASASLLGSGGGGGGGSGLVVSPFMQTMLDDVDAAVARGTIQAAFLHGSLDENFSVNNLFVDSAVFLPGGSVVSPSGYLGLGTNNPLSWLHVAEVSTAPTRYTARVERVTNHTGGTAAQLSTALQVLNIVNAPALNREFGIYAILDNYAVSTYNITGYFGAHKRGAGNIQAGAFEAKDFTGLADPTGALNGITVAMHANGTDAYGTRIGFEMVSIRNNLGGAIATITSGIRIGVADGDSAGSYYTNGITLTDDMQTALMINTSGAHAIQGIWDTGTRAIGIKLSGTYSLGAIVLNAGGRLVFDHGTGACARANAAFPDIVGFELCQVNFERGWNVTGGATNIAATANAGVSGALPAQTSGYLKFRIDGVTYKLPYYNN